MKKMNKTKGIIILIYLFHLFLFVILSYIAEKNIIEWIDILAKLKIPSTVSFYNHIYMIIYYIILSTYYMVKALDLNINKKVGILIQIVGYLFAVIGIYLYYHFESFVEILLITTGLIISINAIYKKINVSSVR